MAMSNEEYRENDIKNVPFKVLFNEYRKAYRYMLEVENEMNRAYRDGEIGEMFANAAELGVISIQLQLLENEVKRRDEEDGPISDEEMLEVEVLLLEEMVINLFK